MEQWRLGRRPGLDGLRGVAILLVVASHILGAAYGFRAFEALGSAGVTLFFTLSGFLITSLLVERVDEGRMSFGRFYRDRALRLMPALLAVVVIFSALSLAVGQHALMNVIPVLLFYSNWAKDAGAGMGVLGTAWSLSIEEQFYFVWPVALILSMRWRRGPVVVAVVGIVVSTALRFALMSGPGGMDRVYYGSDTEAAGLFIGCLLAWAAHRGLREVRVPSWVPAAGACALFAWAFARSPIEGSVVVPTVVPLVAAALIWVTCGTSAALTSRTLRYFGQRSYALYLWHYAFIILVRMATGASLIWALAAFAVSVGAAEASWRMIEEPIRLRRQASQLAADGDGGRGERTGCWRRSYEGEHWARAALPNA